MEWRVIVMVGTYPGISAQRIADVSGVDKSVASRAVTQLTRRGLLSISTHGQPGRKTALTLTAPGREIYDVGMPRGKKLEGLLLSGFSDPERAQMVDFFKRLIANLPLLDQTS
jgi:DNA-binding MarR family transcriptional regulator